MSRGYYRVSYRVLPSAGGFMIRRGLAILTVLFLVGAPGAPLVGIEPGSPVTVGGKTLFSVRARIVSFSPEDCVRLIATRIARLAKEPAPRARRNACQHGDSGADHCADADHRDVEAAEVGAELGAGPGAACLVRVVRRVGHRSGAAGLQSPGAPRVRYDRVKSDPDQWRYGPAAAPAVLARRGLRELNERALDAP
jgi:hypothetical protein